jgi:hypothetical protein
MEWIRELFIPYSVRIWKEMTCVSLIFVYPRLPVDLDGCIYPNLVLIWMEVLIKKFRPWKEREIAVDIQN